MSKPTWSITKWSRGVRAGCPCCRSGPARFWKRRERRQLRRAFNKAWKAW